MRSSRWLKFTAGVLAFLFVLNDIGQAAPALDFAAASLRSEIPRVSHIEIPPEMATLEDWYESPRVGDTRLMLHIQDAHSQPEAQVRTRDLIHYLNKQYGFKTVFVEGAAEQLDVKWLHPFKNPEQNKKWVEEKTSSGEMSGVDLALLDEVAGLKALPIETIDGYRGGYQKLRAVYSKEAEVESFLSFLDSKLDLAASKILDDATRSILSEWKKFESGHRDFLPFVEKLAALAKEDLKLDLNAIYSQIEWPQLSRLLVLQKVEQQLKEQSRTTYNVQRSPLPGRGEEGQGEGHTSHDVQGTNQSVREIAQVEKERLIEQLKLKKVSTGLIKGLERFDEKNLNLNRITVGDGRQFSSPRALVERLVEETRKFEIDLRDYPAFLKYAGYLILRGELQPSLLFKELEKLFEQLLKRKSHNVKGTNDALQAKPQSDLIQIYRDSFLLKKLLNLELSREEWQKAISRRDLISPQNLLESLKLLSGQTLESKGQSHSLKPSASVSSAAIPAKAGVHELSPLVSVFLNAFDFYDAALARENIFFEKISSALAQNDKAILITGGFHTEGMNEFFREKEISYGTLTPRVTNLAPKSLYRDAMTKAVSPPNISSQPTPALAQPPEVITAMTALDGGGVRSESRLQTEAADFVQWVEDLKLIRDPNDTAEIETVLLRHRDLFKHRPDEFPEESVSFRGRNLQKIPSRLIHQLDLAWLNIQNSDAKPVTRTDLFQLVFGRPLDESQAKGIAGYDTIQNIRDLFYFLITKEHGRSLQLFAEQYFALDSGQRELFLEQAFDIHQITQYLMQEMAHNDDYEVSDEILTAYAKAWPIVIQFGEAELQSGGILKRLKTVPDLPVDIDLRSNQDSGQEVILEDWERARLLLENYVEIGDDSIDTQIGLVSLGLRSLTGDQATEVRWSRASSLERAVAVRLEGTLPLSRDEANQYLRWVEVAATDLNLIPQHFKKEQLASKLEALKDEVGRRRARSEIRSVEIDGASVDWEIVENLLLGDTGKFDADFKSKKDEEIYLKIKPANSKHQQDLTDAGFEPEDPNWVKSLVDDSQLLTYVVGAQPKIRAFLTQDKSKNPTGLNQIEFDAGGIVRPKGDKGISASRLNEAGKLITFVPQVFVLAKSELLSGRFKTRADKQAYEVAAREAERQLAGEREVQAKAEKDRLELEAARSELNQRRAELEVRLEQLNKNLSVILPQDILLVEDSAELDRLREKIDDLDFVAELRAFEQSVRKFEKLVKQSPDEIKKKDALLAQVMLLRSDWSEQKSDALKKIDAQKEAVKARLEAQQAAIAAQREKVKNFFDSFSWRHWTNWEKKVYPAGIAAMLVLGFMTIFYPYTLLRWLGFSRNQESSAAVTPSTVQALGQLERDLRSWESTYKLDQYLRDLIARSGEDSLQGFKLLMGRSIPQTEHIEIEQAFVVLNSPKNPQAAKPIPFNIISFVLEDGKKVKMAEADLSLVFPVITPFFDLSGWSEADPVSRSALAAYVLRAYFRNEFSADDRFKALVETYWRLVSQVSAPSAGLNSQSAWRPPFSEVQEIRVELPQHWVAEDMEIVAELTDSQGTSVPLDFLTKGFSAKPESPQSNRLVIWIPAGRVPLLIFNARQAGQTGNLGQLKLIPRKTNLRRSDFSASQMVLAKNGTAIHVVPTAQRPQLDLVMASPIWSALSGQLQTIGIPGPGPYRLISIQEILPLTGLGRSPYENLVTLWAADSQGASYLISMLMNARDMSHITIQPGIIVSGSLKNNPNQDSPVPPQMKFIEAEGKLIVSSPEWLGEGDKSVDLRKVLSEQGAGSDISREILYKLKFMQNHRIYPGKRMEPGINPANPGSLVIFGSFKQEMEQALKRQYGYAAGFELNLVGVEQIQLLNDDSTPKPMIYFIATQSDGSAFIFGRETAAQGTTIKPLYGLNIRTPNEKVFIGINGLEIVRNGKPAEKISWEAVRFWLDEQIKTSEANKKSTAPARSEFRVLSLFRGGVMAAVMGVSFFAGNVVAQDAGINPKAAAIEQSWDANRQLTFGMGSWKVLAGDYQSTDTQKMSYEGRSLSEIKIIFDTRRGHAPQAVSINANGAIRGHAVQKGRDDGMASTFYLMRYHDQYGKLHDNALISKIHSIKSEFGKLILEVEITDREVDGYVGWKPSRTQITVYPPDSVDGTLRMDIEKGITEGLNISEEKRGLYEGRFSGFVAANHSGKDENFDDKEYWDAEAAVYYDAQGKIILEKDLKQVLGQVPADTGFRLITAEGADWMPKKVGGIAAFAVLSKNHSPAHQLKHMPIPPTVLVVPRKGVNHASGAMTFKNGVTDFNSDNVTVAVQTENIGEELAEPLSISVFFMPGASPESEKRIPSLIQSVRRSETRAEQDRQLGGAISFPIVLGLLGALTAGVYVSMLAPAVAGFAAAALFFLPIYAGARFFWRTVVEGKTFPFQSIQSAFLWEWKLLARVLTKNVSNIINAWWLNRTMDREDLEYDFNILREVGLIDSGIGAHFHEDTATGLTRFILWGAENENGIAWDYDSDVPFRIRRILADGKNIYFEVLKQGRLFPQHEYKVINQKDFSLTEDLSVSEYRQSARFVARAHRFMQAKMGDIRFEGRLNPGRWAVYELALFISFVFGLVGLAAHAIPVSFWLFMQDVPDQIEFWLEASSKKEIALKAALTGAVLLIGVFVGSVFAFRFFEGLLDIFSRLAKRPAIILHRLIGWTGIPDLHYLLRAHPSGLSQSMLDRLRATFKVGQQEEADEDVDTGDENVTAMAGTISAQDLEIYLRQRARDWLREHGGDPKRVLYIGDRLEDVFAIAEFKPENFIVVTQDHETAGVAERFLRGERMGTGIWDRPVEKTQIVFNDNEQETLLQMAEKVEETPFDLIVVHPDYEMSSTELALLFDHGQPVTLLGSKRNLPNHFKGVMRRALNANSGSNSAQVKINTSVVLNGLIEVSTSARSENRLQKTSNQIVDALQNYANWLSAAEYDLSSAAARKQVQRLRDIGVFLVLGNPDAQTFIEFAKGWYELSQAMQRQIPIVIAGGIGRGTLGLIDTTLEHYRRLGRLNETEEKLLLDMRTQVEAYLEAKALATSTDAKTQPEHPGVTEKNVIMFIFAKEGVGRFSTQPAEAQAYHPQQNFAGAPVYFENGNSTNTPENFEYSKPVIESLIQPNQKAVIVTEPALLARIRPTLIYVAKVKGWQGDMNWPRARVYPLDLKRQFKPNAMNAENAQRLLDKILYWAGPSQRMIEIFPDSAKNVSELKKYADQYWGALSEGGLDFKVPVEKLRERVPDYSAAEKLIQSTLRATDEFLDALVESGYEIKFDTLNRTFTVTARSESRMLKPQTDLIQGEISFKEARRIVSKTKSDPYMPEMLKLVDSYRLPAQWIFWGEKERSYAQKLSNMSIDELKHEAQDASNPIHEEVQKYGGFDQIVEYLTGKTVQRGAITFNLEQRWTDMLMQGNPENMVQWFSQSSEPLNEVPALVNLSLYRAYLREIIYRWDTAEKPRSAELFKSRSEQRVGEGASSFETLRSQINQGTYDALQHIRDAIALTELPLEIILFGSYADGYQGSGSDLDILFTASARAYEELHQSFSRTIIDFLSAQGYRFEIPVYDTQGVIPSIGQTAPEDLVAAKNAGKFFLKEENKTVWVVSQSSVQRVNLLNGDVQIYQFARSEMLAPVEIQNEIFRGDFTRSFSEAAQSAFQLLLPEAVLESILERAGKSTAVMRVGDIEAAMETRDWRIHSYVLASSDGKELLMVGDSLGKVSVPLSTVAGNPTALRLGPGFFPSFQLPSDAAERYQDLEDGKGRRAMWWIEHALIPFVRTLGFTQLMIFPVQGGIDADILWRYGFDLADDGQHYVRDVTQPNLPLRKRSETRLGFMAPTLEEFRQVFNDIKRTTDKEPFIQSIELNHHQSKRDQSGLYETAILKFVTNAGKTILMQMTERDNGEVFISFPSESGQHALKEEAAAWRGWYSQALIPYLIKQGFTKIYRLHETTRPIREGVDGFGFKDMGTIAEESQIRRLEIDFSNRSEVFESRYAKLNDDFMLLTPSEGMPVLDPVQQNAIAQNYEKLNGQLIKDQIGYPVSRESDMRPIVIKLGGDNPLARRLEGVTQEMMGLLPKDQVVAPVDPKTYHITMLSNYGYPPDQLEFERSLLGAEVNALNAEQVQAIQRVAGAQLQKMKPYELKLVGIRISPRDGSLIAIFRDDGQTFQIRESLQRAVFEAVPTAAKPTYPDLIHVSLLRVFNDFSPETLTKLQGFVRKYADMSKENLALPVEQTVMLHETRWHYQEIEPGSEVNMPLNRSEMRVLAEDVNRQIKILKVVRLPKTEIKALAERLAEIDEVLFTEDVSGSAEYFEATLAKSEWSRPDKFFLLAEQRGKIVGYVYGAASIEFKGYIDVIKMASEVKGVGTMLLDTFLNQAKAAKFKGFEIFVGTGAHGFYKTYFKRIGWELNFFEGNPEHIKMHFPVERAAWQFKKLRVESIKREVAEKEEAKERTKAVPAAESLRQWSEKYANPVKERSSEEVAKLLRGFFVMGSAHQAALEYSDVVHNVIVDLIGPSKGSVTKQQVLSILGLVRSEARETKEMQGGRRSEASSDIPASSAAFESAYEALMLNLNEIKTAGEAAAVIAHLFVDPDLKDEQKISVLLSLVQFLPIDQVAVMRDRLKREHPDVWKQFSRVVKAARLTREILPADLSDPEIVNAIAEGMVRAWIFNPDLHFDWVVRGEQQDLLAAQLSLTVQKRVRAANVKDKYSLRFIPNGIDGITFEKGGVYSAPAFASHAPRQAMLVQETWQSSGFDPRQRVRAHRTAILLLTQLAQSGSMTALLQPYFNSDSQRLELSAQGLRLALEEIVSQIEAATAFATAA